MTLISTYIGKIEQPVLPLIAAAAFNAKTNKIADQIMDMQSKSVDTHREITAKTIEKYFNWNRKPKKKDLLHFNGVILFIPIPKYYQ